MKKKTLHMIANAHLDPVWLWRWQEGFQEVKSTFRSALDRLDEYEDFLFTSSSAAFYEWVEKSDPQKSGGESFVRQTLYGQRYFQEKFGTTARVGYNVDSFGHNGMLPQILAKSRLDYYVFMRPAPHEKGLPDDLFWWESDDGSRVLAFRIPFEYCTTGEDLEKHVRRCAGEISEPFVHKMCFYGVGNQAEAPPGRT